MINRILIGCLLSLNFATIFASEVISINALSVDPQTNRIQIFWTPDPSPDVFGYIIFERDLLDPLQINKNIDTVWGRNSDSYMGEKASTADTNMEYRIQALKPPDQTSLMSAPRRVFVCKVEQLGCERKLNVSWSDARRSILDIARFEIMLSKNDEPYVLVATAESSQRSTTVGISGHLDEYKVYVRAVSSDESIYANSINDTIEVITAPEPEFSYLKTLNVINAETVEMRCHVDVSVVWDRLFAYIADTLVATVTYADFLKNNHLLLPRKHAFYHFEIRDTCGEIATYSNNAKPILLKAELQENTVNLEFSAYQGWIGNDIRYDVFEIRDGDTTLRSTFLPDFIHQISVLNPEQILSLRYYVVAHEEGENPYGFRATAQSNIVDVLGRNEIPVHFPTGFIPDGSTQTYHPFYVSQPNDEMLFQIRNKFGQIMFSTDQPNDGWDGNFRGQPQPGGVYLYLFTLTRNDQTTKKQGWFVVVR